jgi:ketosteroid isomerase-like protein
MRRHWLAPVVFLGALVFLGCGGREEGLSEAQKSAIGQEVIQAVKPLFAAAEKLDVDAMMKLCVDGPELSFVMADGKVFKGPDLQQACKEIFKTFASQKLNTKTERVLVLAPDVALYLWTGGNDMIQKDGVVLRSDPYSATYLYRKVGNVWKFAYGHESGLPWAPVKAEGVPAPK